MAVVFTNSPSGVLKYRRRRSPVFLKHIWARIRRSKQNEIIILQDPGPFALTPNVRTTAGTGHQEVHFFERQAISSYYVGVGRGVEWRWNCPWATGRRAL